MSVLSTIVQAAEAAKVALFFPAWVFPLIAAIVFIFLGFVMYSFRDVANRHSDRIKDGASSHGAEHH